MNRLLKAFAAGAAIVLAGTAQAETEMVAGYEWSYELKDGKTATITNTECFAGSVVIPSKLGGKPVTAIGPNVFKDKEFLERVTIPAGVTAIGENAFSGCELLRAVKIPDSVTAIGASAFSGCSSLVCVDLGKKVNAIGESAFGNCAKLDAIVFRGNAPTDAADQAFAGAAEGCCVYVPKSAKNWPAAGEFWQGLSVVVGDRFVKVVAESSDETYGTVSGSGVAAVGKTITFKATVTTNCLFGGWVEAGAPDIVLSYSKTYSYVVDGYHTGDDAPLFTARFKKSDEDKLSLQTYPIVAWGGYVNVRMLSMIQTVSEPKIAFKGLPAGVKYDAKTLTLAGQAKTPGEYEVELTVSNASKKSQRGSFFIKVPHYQDDEIEIEDAYGTFTPGVAYVENITNAAGCKVTGLPSGMKWTEKAITDKTVGDIPACSAYGAPTKPGRYTVFFTKTTDDKKKHVATTTFRVGPFPVLSIEMTGATGKDKVTGAGAYAANAKVSLKATADTSAKNASEKKVFSCWKDEQGNILSREASYSYVMQSADTTLTAEFITADEDKNSISAGLDGVRLAEDGSPYQTNVMCGVALRWPIAVEALSATTVKVAGLPSGLKFTAKDVVDSKTKEVTVRANTIYGAPTAASKTDKNGAVKPSDVKITVTTAGKASVTYLVKLTVDPLPAWAVGDFSGMVKFAETGIGVASMSVTAAGKISGKTSFLGTNWTFKADSYATSSTTLGTTNLVVSATATVGKATYAVAFEQCAPERLYNNSETVAGTIGDDEVSYCAVLWRIPWTDPAKPEMADLMKSLAGEYACTVLYDGEEYEAAYKLDAKGVAKGTVVLPDGTKTRKESFSTTVVPVGGVPRVIIYIPPNLKKGYPAVFHSEPLAQEEERVQLWEGGPYWATKNIGAEKPEDSGYYFWWGDTVGYAYRGGTWTGASYEDVVWVASDGSSPDFSFGKGQPPTCDKTIDTLQSTGWITADGVLARAHDAAQAHWGGAWRMPTDVDIKDLIAKCEWIPTTRNGVAGYEVRGMGDYAPASIFLPFVGTAAGAWLANVDYGCYWSSVPYPDYSNSSWNLYSYGDYVDGNGTDRSLGLPVRPVQDVTE